MIKETKDGIEFQLRISPNASKNEVIKTSESVKIKITAPPVDGKANKCLIEYLSKLFRVPKTSIVILRGETSKDKTLLIKISDGDKIKLVKNILE
ncbi:MAG: YggU family protein [Brachyspira sp.]|jgi:TIGR00251 family protein|nr:YggU family protein [Brachyspira sp.]